jgi:predicted phosphoribosyltransferase
MKFHDRTHAAFLLADELKKYSECNGVVLAIPRGAVPMGYTIAHQLGLPLDIIMVKKIGHPYNPEYAIGSVSLTDVILTDTQEATDAYIQQEVVSIRKAMKEKYSLFMGDRKPVELKGKIAILVDDGLATGNTMLACVEQVRKSHPHKIIVAVPVASDRAFELIERKADELICLYTTSDFYAVGQFYEQFDQVTDEEVIEFIKKSAPVAAH